MSEFKLILTLDNSEHVKEKTFENITDLFNYVEDTKRIIQKESLINLHSYLQNSLNIANFTYYKNTFLNANLFVKYEDISEKYLNMFGDITDNGVFSNITNIEIEKNGKPYLKTINS